MCKHRSRFVLVPLGDGSEVLDTKFVSQQKSDSAHTANAICYLCIWSSIAWILVFIILCSARFKISAQLNERPRFQRVSVWGLYCTIQLSCSLTGAFHLKNSFCGCSTEQGSDVPTRHGANIWIVFWTYKIRLAWETAWVEQKNLLSSTWMKWWEVTGPQRCSLQYDEYYLSVYCDEGSDLSHMCCH